MVSTTRLYQIDRRLKQTKPENDGLICKYLYSKKDQAKACKDAPDSAMRAHLSKAFFYFCKASPELSMSTLTWIIMHKPCGAIICPCAQFLNTLFWRWNRLSRKFMSFGEIILRFLNDELVLEPNLKWNYSLHDIYYKIFSAFRSRGQKLTSKSKSLAKKENLRLKSNQGWKYIQARRRLGWFLYASKWAVHY